ncbi:hypothetical protein KCU59_g4, partial [Aureobasidium melanogenum]
LLGPRFRGWRLKAHVELERLQLAVDSGGARAGGQGSRRVATAMCVAVARAVGLVAHVAAAGHDVVAGRHDVVAASVDVTCLPTRELSGSDPATCSTRREGPDHHRSRDAVDDACYHCSTGYSRALEKGRLPSAMRKGYVRSPST